MEVEKIKQDFEFQIRNLNAVIEVLADDIKEIKKALVGSEYGDEGLVKRVANQEKQIQELIRFKQRIIAWATSAGLGSGTLINIIMEMLK